MQMSEPTTANRQRLDMSDPRPNRPAAVHPPCFAAGPRREPTTPPRVHPFALRAGRYFAALRAALRRDPDDLAGARRRAIRD